MGETINEERASTNKPNDEQYRKFAVFLIFIFPAIGGMLFGYDIGATSTVIPQLTSEDNSGVKWHGIVNDSSFLQGAITAVGMVGAMLSSLYCFQVADILGRRMELLIAATLYAGGAAIEFISGDASFDSTSGITTLMIGRLVYGFGCGFCMHGAPAYIGEMAPYQIRGLLVSLKEAFIVVGITLGYSIGYGMSYLDGGWKYTYGFAIIPASVMFLGVYYLPPSCRWLALKGNIEEAKLSLMFVSPDLPSAEVRSLEEMSQKKHKEDNNTSTEERAELMSPEVFPALVAGVGLVVFQQITGQPSVLYYANTIFADVGLDAVAAVAIAVFKLIATLFATFTVDNYGRKSLLYVGCSMMLFALVMLSVVFIFPTGDGFTPQKAAILVALFIYIGGYQVGYGPVVWLFISEIFPLEVRGKAVAIAVVTNFFFNAVMVFLFPVELQYIGAAATFFIYTFVLLIGIYFIRNYVPETKGLTLEEIEAYFKKNSKKSKHARGLLDDTKNPLLDEA